MASVRNVKRFSFAHALAYLLDGRSPRLVDGETLRSLPGARTLQHFGRFNFSDDMGAQYRGDVDTIAPDNCIPGATVIVHDVYGKRRCLGILLFMMGNEKCVVLTDGGANAGGLSVALDMNTLYVESVETAGPRCIIAELDDVAPIGACGEFVGRVPPCLLEAAAAA